MPVTNSEAEDLAAVFRASLRKLHAAVRSPSYRTLQRQANLKGLQLATSTIGDLLKRSGIPRWETVKAFVSSCEKYATAQRLSLPKDTFDLDRWYADHERLMSAVVDRARHSGRTITSPLIQLYPAEADRRPRIRPANSPTPSVADSGAARTWLNTELPNLVSVCAHSAAHGWPSHTTRLAAILFRYLDLGSHVTEAAAIYTHACHAARDSGDRNGEAHALTSLGGVYWQQGRYQDAADTVARALTIFWKTGDRLGEGRALTSLGIICWRQGRYEQAIDYNHQALALYRQTNDLRGEGRALGNLGNIHSRQGHYRQAADYHNQALTLYQRTKDRAGEADALTNLGLVYHSQDRHQQAADHHHRALTLYQEIGDRNGQARAHNGLGEQLHTAGQFNQACLHHEQALDLSLHTGDRYEQARAHNGLGHAYRATGHQDQARHHWHQAHTIYTELNVPDVHNVSTALAMLGQSG